MKKTVFLFVSLLVAVSAMAKDIRKVIVTTTPKMHCEACENKIKGNIRFEKGVKMIETDIEKQTVTITYDADKTTVEKLVKGFGKFGYEARELKACDKDAAGRQGNGYCCDKPRK